MGRGRSKLGKSAKGAPGTTPEVKGVTSVVTQSGQTVDLTDTPLIYGDNDPTISGALRNAVESQEKKRLSAKIEYAIVYDSGGNALISEAKGGKSGVRISVIALNRGEVMTHNHPRGKGEEGVLGGTFSYADLNTFASRNFRTIRASAAEGTYSMTKTSGFDPAAFKKFAKGVSDKHDTIYRDAMTKLNSEAGAKIRRGEMAWTDYKAQADKLFNAMLVGCHNDMLAGQKQYGYTYTLEGR